LIAAAAAANHPRGPGATCLGTEVVVATVVGVIRGSPTAIFFYRKWKLVAATAAANHPHGLGATCLGAEVVLLMAAGMIRGSPAAIFFCRVW
jgi:hypothetical protein